MLFFFFSATFNNLLADTSQSWQLAMVSEEITGNASERDSIENVQHYFSDKKVIIKNNVLDIDGFFSCEIVDEKMTPLNYWYSEKTVSSYRNFLKKYGVTLGDKIDVVTSLTPDSQCQFPFSEFVKIGSTLIFSYKDRAVLYYLEDDVRLKKIMHQEKESVTTNDNVSCQESSNEIDIVYTDGYIVTCIYPNTYLLSTYLKYREENKNDGMLKFLKKRITPGKNEKIMVSSDFIFQYKWKSKDELEINVSQPGGSAIINFLQTTKGTTVKTISSPD